MLTLKQYLGAAAIYAALALIPVSTFVMRSDAQQRATSVQTSGTITLTDAFQVAKAADDQRRICKLQNKGTNTIFVFMGALANATKDGSFEVLTKLYFFTNDSGVSNTDPIIITGTTGDKWVLNCQ